MANALEDLLDALEDVDDATREEAAKTLADLGDPSTLEALIGACSDDFWSVRAHAGCGVAKIGGPKAIEALIGLFNDPIMEVRDQAVEATAKMGSIVLDRLVTAIERRAVARTGTCRQSRRQDQGLTSRRCIDRRVSRPRRSRQECRGRSTWAESPIRRPFRP